MKEAALVFLVGGLGSVMRFSLGKWIASFNNTYFPYGTLAINIIACFMVGLVISLADHRQLISPSTKVFLTIGFCGGFSTFSTFSAETISLMQNGFYLSTVVYVASSLLLCIAATYAGLFLGNNL